mmetsp:Transcript_40373/g.111133  ORF Transcript_40373/g.111133 Transcript_40373/m.111133 type:complete len:239 (-) Transcript_40373:701-1417(-)
MGWTCRCSCGAPCRTGAVGNSSARAAPERTPRGRATLCSRRHLATVRCRGATRHQLPTTAPQCRAASPREFASGEVAKPSVVRLRRPTAWPSSLCSTVIGRRCASTSAARWRARTPRSSSCSCVPSSRFRRCRRPCRSECSCPASALHRQSRGSRPSASACWRTRRRSACPHGRRSGPWRRSPKCVPSLSPSLSASSSSTMTSSCCATSTTSRRSAPAPLRRLSLATSATRAASCAPR